MLVDAPAGADGGVALGGAEEAVGVARRPVGAEQRRRAAAPLHGQARPVGLLETAAPLAADHHVVPATTNNEPTSSAPRLKSSSFALIYQQD